MKFFNFGFRVLTLFMPTQKHPNRIPALDHLRALAITLVFLYHYRMFSHPEWIDIYCQFGWAGVDLFFVLSGYLISGQIFKGIQRGNFSLETFFIKRSFRILPAFWTVLTLYFLLPDAREWHGGLAPLWKYLTFTQNYGLDLRHHRAFSHAWSLCVEEQFYMLLPLTILLLVWIKASRVAPYILVVLFLAGMGIRLMGWNNIIEPAIGTDAFGLTWYKWIYYPSYNRLDPLLAGIAIGGITVWYPRAAQAMHKYANLLLLLGLMFAVVAYFVTEEPLSYHATIFGFALLAIAFGCMVASGTAANSLLNKFSSKITTAIATLSYGMYLSHKMVVNVVQQQLPRYDIPTDGNLSFFICTAASIITAALLYFIVEKPFMMLKDRIVARQ